MSPLEILLSLATRLAFCILATPRLRALHWMGYVALITVLIAGIQIRVEGPRWEMIPAYVFAGVFALVWLLPNFAPAGASSDNSEPTALPSHIPQFQPDGIEIFSESGPKRAKISRWTDSRRKTLGSEGVAVCTCSTSRPSNH